MKWKPSVDDDMRTRFLRRSFAFGGFALIYLGGSALLDYLTGELWEPDPFVLVAYAAGAMFFVIMPPNKNSDDPRV